jgi:hypothetical protein
VTAEGFFDTQPSRDWAHSAQLVTPRNNFDYASGTQLAEVGGRSARATAFRVPRPYVALCSKASLGLFYSGGQVVFKALTCGSWSCPTCRKKLAASTLSRLRSGMEARESRRYFVTLTLDPSEFGAHVVGTSLWEGGRQTRLWSEPTAAQFKKAVAAMSREFKRLLDSLNSYARRRGLDRWRYFRVVELHRNGWPHYHVVFEHDELPLESVSWGLGRSDVRPVSLDDAVGEVAPYLVCSEKGGGSKAYQFAASALPKHFRLYTASENFLGAPVADDSREKPEHALALRGHFTDHHRAVRDEGAESMIVLPAPAEPDRPHRPPSSSQASGDGAVLYYLRLVESQIEHAPPDWFRTLDEKLFKEHHDRL